MNKELIKIYFEEFKHWLNGGNVQVYYKKDDEPKWLTDEECIEYEGHDNFSHIMQNSLEPDDVLIAIDDYYIKFRTAMAEGKIVEYLGYKNEWKNLTENCRKLEGIPLEELRIKPERQKFKTGDWVIHNGVVKRVTKAVDGYIDSLDNEVAVIMKEESLELWEPKEGDICSFWNKSNIYPRLATFINESLGSYYADTSHDGFDFCEPYLGKLPSNLKQDSKNISVE